jgi:hypothetical protein
MKSSRLFRDAESIFHKKDHGKWILPICRYVTGILINNNETIEEWEKNLIEKSKWIARRKSKNLGQNFGQGSALHDLSVITRAYSHLSVGHLSQCVLISLYN